MRIYLYSTTINSYIIGFSLYPLLLFPVLFSLVSLLALLARADALDFSIKMRLALFLAEVTQVMDFSFPLVV